MKKLFPFIWLLSLSTMGKSQSCPPRYHFLNEQAGIYVSYNMVESGFFPSNNMFIVTDAGIVLLDTPWDTAMFQPFLDDLEEMYHKPVVLCIATHSHDDRTAGLEYFESKGIPTWSSKMTRDLCVQNGEKKAANIFVNDTTFKVGELTFETFYPGEGHAPDNIVIWIPELKLLYGGCFVKSVETNNLGNLADANQPEWEVSLRKVIEKYPKPEFIVPGHFNWSKKNALKHTLKLVNHYPRR